MIFLELSKRKIKNRVVAFLFLVSLNFIYFTGLCIIIKFTFVIFVKSKLNLRKLFDG